jgi:transposase InsO family protein/transposase-like protein
MSKKKTTKKAQTKTRNRKSSKPRPEQPRRYSDEERRAAVRDATALGLSSAAHKHGVPVSTLHGWTKSPQWDESAEPNVGVSSEPPVRGRRFTPEERQRALELIAAGMTRKKVAQVIGTSTQSLRNWVEQAQKDGTMPSKVRPQRSATARTGDTSQSEPAKRSVYAPRDPGQGLSDIETAAILELKKKHPSMGPAQIRAQLKRFKGWRVSIKAIARVLRAHGYELVHRGSRPQGPEPVRFEAPRRNALWQLDYAEMRVVGEVRHLLVVLDDFSRYCVGHHLGERPSAKTAIMVLERAMARHGKPEAVRSDRGGAFMSKEFGNWLEAELIDHIVGRAYHPQGGGKVESLIGTVRRELWDTEHFAGLDEAMRRLDEFLFEYNERRAHMGIDGLTPADRFFGRADRVLSTIDAISRQRQGSLLHASLDSTIEELLRPQSGSPLEVLRLVAIDGRLELRFVGHRVVLGPLEQNLAL